MSVAAERFLDSRLRPTPCLVVDLGEVADAYRRVQRSFPGFRIQYSVKANPAPEILRCLHALGAAFDVTSRAEIALCLRLGIAPDRLAYGHPVKKAADIAWAHRRRIRGFSFDSAAELEKLASHAPGAAVSVRVAVDNAGSAWPLDRKFGCEAATAPALMRRAAAAGLHPVGLSFHVGSQQMDPVSWERAVALMAGVARVAAADGLPVRLLNVGGGLPVRYQCGTPTLGACAGAIRGAVERHFGHGPPALVIEPGRYLVAAAGIIESEVVLVTRKAPGDPRRWVYLDIGRFGGLAETEGGAIRYPIEAKAGSGPGGPVILAGPSCDSADILYESAGYELPLELTAGDRVRIRCAGAYTTVYASRFNGFPVLRSHFVDTGRAVTLSAGDQLVQPDR